MKLAAAFAGVVLIATVQSASIRKVKDIAIGLDDRVFTLEPEDAIRTKRVLNYTKLIHSL
jgi:hypothetical protein